MDGSRGRMDSSFSGLGFANQKGTWLQPFYATAVVVYRSLDRAWFFCGTQLVCVGRAEADRRS